MFGFSYGSHLGLAVLRRIPARIDRAAFMAIESPDRTFKTPAQVQEGLEVLDRLVQADSLVLPVAARSSDELCIRLEQAIAVGRTLIGRCKGSIEVGA